MSKHSPARKRPAPQQPPSRQGDTAPVSSGAASGPAPSRERIAVRAYELWEAQGRPQGADREHWFEAERQLRAGDR
jgi:hypothetical protein